MSRTLSDARVRDMVTTARVAGHRYPGSRRTGYLEGAQLRQASLPRLVTEVARAEHPDATASWRDRRRSALADELDRREFPSAAGSARESWDSARYAETQADIARDNADLARARAEMARQDAEQSWDESRRMDRTDTESSVGVSPVAATALIGGGIVGLALMSEAMDVEQEQIDAEYLAGEDGLAQEWSTDMEDPTVGGESMVPTEATDLSVSVADSLAGAATLSPEAAGPAQTVEQEVELTPEL